MAFLCLLTMLAVIALAYAVTRWGDARTAWRLLEHSQHLFEPEPFVEPLDSSPASRLSAAKPTTRKKFSPLVSKQIAARQHFRCSLCNRMFDDQLWDLDHIVPLFRGGSNDLSNIRALCRACHMELSASQRAL